MSVLQSETSPSPTYTIRGMQEIGGACVKYTLEVPEDITDPVPAIFINGYCGVKGAYHQMRNTMAEAGKPAATFHSPRAQKLCNRLSKNNLLHVDKIQSQAAWAVMRALGYDQYDLIGHSMGGKTAVDAAEAKSEHVRSTLLIASAGLDLAPGQRHRLLTMIGRGGMFLLRELYPSLGEMTQETRLTIAKQAGYHVLRDIPRTVQEGIDAATCNVSEKVRKIGQLGVKTGGLIFEGDNFFKASDILRNNMHAFDVLEVYPDPNADHIAPQKQPREVSMASLDILNRLNYPGKLSAA